MTALPAPAQALKRAILSTLRKIQKVERKNNHKETQESQQFISARYAPCRPYGKTEKSINQGEGMIHTLCVMTPIGSNRESKALPICSCDSLDSRRRIAYTECRIRAEGKIMTTLTPETVNASLNDHIQETNAKIRHLDNRATKNAGDIDEVEAVNTAQAALIAAAPPTPAPEATPPPAPAAPTHESS